MTLQSNLPKFKDAVEKIYSNNKNTPAQCAEGIANAVFAWATKGIPMTKHPATMSGEGGIDIVTPGTGLAPAKPKLQADIELGFKNQKNSSSDAAKHFTDAHMAFFSKARIMTIVTAPVGTPPAPYVGTGKGGIDKPSPGKGLAAALPEYISALTAIYSNNSKSTTTSDYAKKMADASYSFLSQALIETKDSGASGAGGKSDQGTIL